MPLPDVNQMAAAATQPQVAADGDYAPTVAWETPGQFVYGQVLDVRMVNTQNGDSYVVELEDQQQGTVQFWAGTLQLRAGLIQGQNQISRPIQTGDVVYVRYDGKTALGGGKSAKNFSINVAANPNGTQAPPQQQAPAQQQPQYQQPTQPPQQTQQWQPQQAPQQQWQPQAPGQSDNTVPF